ncbi:AraC family transcriptional regulator [Vibrio viridaestus]|uniref:Helix-turn-helix domain-containing protein n=1 Tax=Vibrio viridaestus TaxID=2487322 RepID=A0A3N9U0U8_9VIBR|nr:AraC family transcriptional regulator N-terminal domain-containing protein [Vibrio viridaestus]RQW62902.1 helix-turn-helix domain-containing protein [Vibrio viridaestus]
MTTLVEWLEKYTEINGLQNFSGTCETDIPGIWFYRSIEGNERKPLLYQSGVLILAQGLKNIYLDQSHVTYGPNDYLVVGVPLPIECEAIPDKGKPLMGISIRIEPHILQKMVHKLELSGHSGSQDCHRESCGLCSVSMSKEMEDTCLRIMKALCHPVEAHIIGESLLEELIYRVLISKAGYVLFELASKEGHYSRVANVLARVHQDYSRNLTVNELAKEANMSVSAFHLAFRSVTMESPLQYIKKVRLNRARELIQLEGRRVNEAARMVGYTSPSQFHREYKRLFKETPREDKLPA